MPPPDKGSAAALGFEKSMGWLPLACQVLSRSMGLEPGYFSAGLPWTMTCVPRSEVGEVDNVAEAEHPSEEAVVLWSAAGFDNRTLPPTEGRG